MSEFKYKVSVIIPVYNMEQYIDPCMKTLLGQTIDFSEIEILFIDDGSKDDSAIKIERYRKMYNNVKLIRKDNGGVSSARNVGIKSAQGKYLLYLDADDEISQCTIKEVTNFFDTVYDRVDVCTYKLVRYQNGKALKEHFRYKYMNKTGIYNLSEFPFITQSHMCIVVKNDKNKFFCEDLSLGEDQLYITEFLMDKNAIGYSDKGEYRYNRHENSAMSSTANIINMFEQRMQLFESLIDKCDDDNRKYVQGIILGNWCWEIRSDLILPYHYEGQEYENAYERIRKVIDFLDIDIIMSHPDLDNFHKHFFISLKRNINPTIICGNNNTRIMVEQSNVYMRKGYEIVLESIDVENHEVIIRGFIKSPVFSYDVVPKLYVKHNNEIIEIELFHSINSCYKSKMVTNRFYGFICEVPLEANNEFLFEVELDGEKFSTDFYLLPTVIINRKLGINAYFREKYEITVDSNIIHVNRCEDQKIYEEEYNLKLKDIKNNQIYSIRKQGIEYRNSKRVWLYVDSFSVKYDNAYYQFLNDFEKKDGIERWYIWSRSDDEAKDLFSEEQLAYVVNAKSLSHKILYIAAEYVFASFSEMNPRVPFESETEWSYYRDICKAKVIYLQHGICHADLRYTQSAERRKVDKIVVSSFFERENYVKNYHYRDADIIQTGMARYDYIDRKKKPANRILFAPSWRSYLTGEIVESKREINDSLLLESDYYKKYINFLNDERLNDLLEENDLYLDAKLHQNMLGAIDKFKISRERINVVNDNVHVEDYLIFITDISSYVYDYLYLERPVIYFMPDMKEFTAGMNSYRKLDIPFEEAFGNVCFEVDQAIDEIKRIIENNFEVEDVYRQRMKDFFLPLNKCRDSLYNYLFKEKL